MRAPQARQELSMRPLTLEGLAKATGWTHKQTSATLSGLYTQHEVATLRHARISRRGKPAQIVWTLTAKGKKIAATERGGT